MRQHSLLGAFFIVLVATVAWAQTTDNQPDPIQPELDRVKPMDAAAQLDWMRRLEQRALRAAKLVLDENEAARQQEHIRQQLRNTTVSWAVLREVVQTVDVCEKKAIEQLMRRYRSLAFETFRKQTDELERRRRAWFDVYLDWKLAGASFRQQDVLIDWLEQAIASASPESIGPIPDRPRFEGLPTAEASSESHPAASDIRRAEPPALPKETRVAPPHPWRGAAAETTPARGGAVGIKSDELASRIAGCNLALRALEAELEEPGPWNAARLAPMVARLKILSLRRDDLEMFRNALPEAHRESLGEPSSARVAAKSLLVRIDEARRDASSPQFPGAEAERRRLEGLARELAKIAGE